MPLARTEGSALTVTLWRPPAGTTPLAGEISTHSSRKRPFQCRSPVPGFSISKVEQAKRFESRKVNPLKQWKISPVDEEAQAHWDIYTHYKEEMFSKTHTSFSPWTIVKANNKKRARLESIRHVLSRLAYNGKGESATSLHPDPSVVTRFHRSHKQID